MFPSLSSISLLIADGTKRGPFEFEILRGIGDLLLKIIFCGLQFDRCHEPKRNSVIPVHVIGIVSLFVDKPLKKNRERF